MTDTWTHADVRRFFDRLSDHVEDWQGVPIPLGEDMPLVLAQGHPLRDVYRKLGETEPVEVEVLVHSGPEFTCTDEDVCEEETIVNEWYSHRRNCRVFVVDRAGRRFCLTLPVSPDRSMDRLTFWLQTMGAADAWDVEAEGRARAKLRGMLSERQWMHYDLTGSFFETSPRSAVTYVFRRLRPTIAMSPRGKNGRDTMRCLAVLCMHSVGYYANSWAGCMVPSDDVIAHLLLMRGDEAFFWRKANQHEFSSPEAGL